MQVAQTPSFLNTISQVLNPVQSPKQVTAQSPDKTGKKNLVTASAEDGKAGQTQSAPPATSTRRGSSVNLLV